MTLEEIKIRRLANQYLTEKGEKLRVIHDLMGFQAQFMSNALHSMRLGCSGCDAESAAEGLAKNWTVRGTVHIFAEDDLGAPPGVFRRGGGDVRRVGRRDTRPVRARSAAGGRISILRTGRNT